MPKTKSVINFWLAFVLFIIMLAIYFSIKSFLAGESQPDANKIPVKKESLTVPNSYDELVHMQLDIRYATKNNFTKEQIYPCGRCFLRKEAKQALAEAEKELKKKGYKFVLFDCYRPATAQQKLWEIVPNPDYVTPPEKGSMHNRGLAVDLSLMDIDGNLLDMGTSYDYFGKEAHTDYMDQPKEVLDNRKLLTETMEKYGFKGIRTEWWHFSFQNLSSPINSWEWGCNK
jgi:D-alanyl-D-alanine dipeptidase